MDMSFEHIPIRRLNTEYYSVPWTSVRSIVIDPTDSQTLYAGDYNSGVYMTNDGGSTWYPQACQFLKLRHHIHSFLAKKRKA